MGCKENVNDGCTRWTVCFSDKDDGCALVMNFSRKVEK